MLCSRCTNWVSDNLFVAIELPLIRAHTFYEPASLEATQTLSAGNLGESILRLSRPVDGAGAVVCSHGTPTFVRTYYSLNFQHDDI